LRDLIERLVEFGLRERAAFEERARARRGVRDCSEAAHE
jgi:hypothetical protein